MELLAKNEGVDETNALPQIELGLQCARQGLYDDAIVHFALACQQLPDSHARLANTMNAFIKGHEGYWQAQAALHEASQSFAMASIEQRDRLEVLEELLSKEGAPDNGSRPADDQSLALGTDARPPRLTMSTDGTLPGLRISCLGVFEVHRSQERIPPCHNRSGQTILRYLAAHGRHRETSDVLMDVLWPDDRPEVARHKLHCATSALRQTLNGSCATQKGAGYLVHEDGVYGLTSSATIEIDADEVLAGYAAGQRVGGEDAVPHYEMACRLYTGPFLPEDVYADWSQVRREQLTQAYLSMCTALADHHQRTGNFETASTWALRILEQNRCDESAYQQLMRAYASEGRRSESIRQYRRCESVLREDLGVRPMPETRGLFERILRGEVLPSLPAAAGRARN